MPHTFTCRLILVLIFGLPLSGDAHAQNTFDSKAGVVFRVLTFDRVKDLKEIDLVEGEKSMEISMHKNNFTGPYKASSRVLRFSRPAVEGEGKRVFAGMVKVPDSLGSRVLLIAVPTNKKTYHFFPFSDDIQSFRAGEMKLINLTQVVITAKLNSKPFKVAPLKTTNVGKLSQNKDAHSYPVEFYFQEGKAWRPISSSYWQYEPDVRNLTFCFKEPKTGRIRIRTIRELPSVKPSQL
jgi:hypothetical protein